MRTLRDRHAQPDHRPNWKSVNRLIGYSVIFLAGTGVCRAQSTDLAITHAAVLDVTTGTVLRERTVLVANGIITGVVPSGPRAPQASRSMDAHGRLLTPGFIDAHLHLCSIYFPPCTTPRAGTLRLSMAPDSIASYRRTLASLYLPYGVTAVRDVGSEERVMPLLLAWMKRSPDAPDFYPVGAHLISPDPAHTPAPWQVQVADSAAAAAKVRAYYALGIRRSGTPELRAHDRVGIHRPHESGRGQSVPGCREAHRHGRRAISRVLFHGGARGMESRGLGQAAPRGVGGQVQGGTRR